MNQIYLSSRLRGRNVLPIQKPPPILRRDFTRTIFRFFPSPDIVLGFARLTLSILDFSHKFGNLLGSYLSGAFLWDPSILSFAGGG